VKICGKQCNNLNHPTIARSLYVFETIKNEIFDLEEFEQGQPKFVLFLATLVEVSILN
jgi:hypothetical protein